MAEVKNAFIKSKMNLDLDARLVPQGEYRQGFNIQVSKSEGDDVGALENVLGNELLPQGDFQALTSTNNLQVIGHITNPANDTVYLFLTNNTGISYDPSATNLIYSYNVSTKQSSKLVQGAFLNFSTQNFIYGINIVENLLFWTDNRNQPRKINITRPLGYYTTEDHISVAKFAPYEAINLYQESSVAGEYETTMKDVVSPNYPDGTTNPYKNPTYAGDPDYLEDKFVRFSYRFRYDDNEYSVLAPFTQDCFIPKQDGYFLTTGAAGTTTDEDETYRSTVVNFMENKVNEITLNIPLPKAIDGSDITTATLNNILKVTEIDIVYKESDSQAVQVVDTLLVNTDFESKYTGSTINYIYQSLKPYKTLPEADLVRVYDKVPVRALSQEVSGNRVIYGNFQDKHTPLFENSTGNLTSQLDYKLGAFNKSTFSLQDNITSIKEYPNSTLKQNRNYQAGVVLSDRYGRSSTVLLSNFIDESTPQGAGSFTASTHYHAYTPSSTSNSVISWPGDSLKILFNSPINSPAPEVFPNSGIPGLYSSSGNEYNVLGWYSYKIVVKQLEQEYYNVYLPGILNGPPDGVTGLNDSVDEVGFITLINDNINKVPRDLSEVGPEQKQFRSSVQLFGRVTPDFVSATFPTYNKQFYPGIQSNTVITIGEAGDVLGQDVTNSQALVTNLYDSKSNPLIARISQIDSLPIGSAAKAGAYPFQLSVFETEPTESRLDIYYETSTSGLIEELNAAIISNTDSVTNAVGNKTLSFNENQSHSSGNVDILPPPGPGPNEPGWAPVNASSLGKAVNQDLPANRLTATITSVTSRDSANGEPQKRDTNLFAIKSITPTSAYNENDETTWYRYVIQSTQDLCFNEGAEFTKDYAITVAFTDVNGVGVGSVNFTNVTLGNTSPIFEKYTPSNGPDVVLQGSSNPPSALPSNFVLQLTQGQVGTLATFHGLNGTAKSDENTLGLTWSITSPANQTIFSIGEKSGVLSTTEDLTGPYSITITLTDDGGPADATDFPLTLLFGKEALNSEFGRTSNYPLGGGGQSGALYFVNNLTNAAGSLPLPGVAANSNNDIRAPYSNLGLGTNVKEVSDNNGNESVINFEVPGCQGYTMGNRNQNAMALQQGGTSAGLDQTQAGLRQGTAFIGVEINFEQQTPTSVGFNSDERPYLMYPIYLQYKPFGANTWEDAYDIEGKKIRFGGSQINRADFAPSNGQVEDIGPTGIINKISAPQYFSESVNSYPNNFSNNIEDLDCLEVNTQVKNPGTNVTQNAIARKTFAIGKSSYAGISDKFGDYRLIIRYPWGARSSKMSSGSSNMNDPIVVGYGSGQCPIPGFIPSGAGSGFGSMISANVFFDDFYYPFIYGGTNIYAYKYRVATLPKNDPNQAALLQTTTTGVYAREWHMKYVTKFYTDPDLTKEYKPGAGWYGYTPWENNSINANFGTDFSNVVAQGSPKFGVQQNNFRRWVAYFDGNGLKSLVNFETPSLPTNKQELELQ